MKKIKQHKPKIRPKKWNLFYQARMRLGIDQGANFADKLELLKSTYYYYEQKAEGCSYQALLKLREVGGFSWDDIGKMIERHVERDA